MESGYTKNNPRIGAQSGSVSGSIDGSISGSIDGSIDGCVSKDEQIVIALIKENSKITISEIYRIYQ